MDRFEVLASAEVAVARAPTMPTRSPAAAKELPAFFEQSSITPTMPTHRRGEDRLAFGLVVEGHVAGDHRVSSATQASAMPRQACSNCHMISGRSGLPSSGSR